MFKKSLKIKLSTALLVLFSSVFFNNSAKTAFATQYSQNYKQDNFKIDPENEQDQKYIEEAKNRFKCFFDIVNESLFNVKYYSTPIFSKKLDLDESDINWEVALNDDDEDAPAMPVYYLCDDASTNVIKEKPWDLEKDNLSEKEEKILNAISFKNKTTFGAIRANLKKAFTQTNNKQQKKIFQEFILNYAKDLKKCALKNQPEKTVENKCFKFLARKICDGLEKTNEFYSKNKYYETNYYFSVAERISKAIKIIKIAAKELSNTNTPLQNDYSQYVNKMIDWIKDDEKGVADENVVDLNDNNDFTDLNKPDDVLDGYFKIDSKNEQDQKYIEEAENRFKCFFDIVNKSLFETKFYNAIFSEQLDLSDMNEKYFKGRRIYSLWDDASNNNTPDESWNLKKDNLSEKEEKILNAISFKNRTTFGAIKANLKKAFTQTNNKRQKEVFQKMILNYAKDLKKCALENQLKEKVENKCFKFLTEKICDCLEKTNKFYSENNYYEDDSFAEKITDAIVAIKLVAEKLSNANSRVKNYAEYADDMINLIKESFTNEDDNGNKNGVKLYNKSNSQKNINKNSLNLYDESNSQNNVNKNDVKLYNKSNFQKNVSKNSLKLNQEGKFIF